MSPVIRRMRAADLAEATRIWRLAFATFFREPDPSQYRLDIATIETRFATDPANAFVAEHEGRLLGSVIGMSWGTQFVLGPLTVDPAFWGQGVARALTRRILDEADARGAGLVTLFTFPQSATHLRLYESVGFAPMHLTPVMAKPVASPAPAAAFRLFSSLASREQEAALARCRALTERIYPGLDVTREILACETQRLGETVLTETDGALAGVALTHFGAGTEAGEGVAFVKFAAVAPGAAIEFERLLDAIENLAAQRTLERIIAGINTARRHAYRRLLARGFRAGFVGVAMHRPDEPGTLRPELYVIDDWR